MIQTRQRPMGVTILAVLAFLVGISGILGAIGILALGGGYVMLGVIALVLALLELGLGYGFWTLQPWAWTLGITLQVINIVLNVIYLFTQRSNALSDIVSIVIS